jgi:hypothetical protein
VIVPELQILPSDIQTAMQGDERVSLRVQLAAAMRRITELEAEQCQCSQVSSNGHVPVEAMAEAE